MARPRKPIAILDASGETLKNPKRYRGRNRIDLAVPPLGPPSVGLTPEQRARYEHLRRELWWLRRPDTALCEAAAIISARLLDHFDLKLQGELIKLLIALGATPAARAAFATRAVPDDLVEKYLV